MDKDIFAKRLGQLGIKRQVDAAMIVARSQSIINEKFGEQRVGDNLKVVSYHKGMLKIASSSNAWATECQGIVGQLKKPPVERVVFMLGGITEKES